jgi:glucose-1-phosphate adenylyltransferase
MVNAGISKIGVVVHDNYRSLVDHIGTGKDWDLARRSGGIKLLPPFITAFGNAGASKLYRTRLEAIVGIGEFISRCNEDVVVFSDCDTVCNMDMRRLLKFHEQNNADVTIVTVKASLHTSSLAYADYLVESDAKGRITDIIRYTYADARAEISANIMVINRVYLMSIINQAISRGYTELYGDILSSDVDTRRMFAYNHKGCMMRISSLSDYYSASMRLLSSEVRADLIEKSERPIYTKVRNSAPTLYKEGASVKNSYIADGCEIEGRVENSIIFRGVKISKGALVKDSIILQNTFIGENSTVNSVIADKDVTVKSARSLSGHVSTPFYISKGAIV